jgi:hypothetical protein
MGNQDFAGFGGVFQAAGEVYVTEDGGVVLRVSAPKLPPVQ